MSDFPIIKSQGGLSLTRSGMSDNGIASIHYDEWLEFGKQLWEARQAIQWAIGDWVNYGEAHYGEKYAQALDITEYSYGTLANYAYVAKSFETSRRRENLSWSHHAAVRGIEDETEQDALLDIAESQQMGRDELREVVKKYKDPDGLLVVGDEKPYRVIEGEIIWAVFWVFVPVYGENVQEGKAILHLYEERE